MSHTYFHVKSDCKMRLFELFSNMSSTEKVLTILLELLRMASSPVLILLLLHTRTGYKSIVVLQKKGEQGDTSIVCHPFTVSWKLSF